MLGRPQREMAIVAHAQRQAAEVVAILHQQGNGFNTAALLFGRASQHHLRLRLRALIAAIQRDHRGVLDLAAQLVLAQFSPILDDEFARGCRLLDHLDVRGGNGQRRRDRAYFLLHRDRSN